MFVRNALRPMLETATGRAAIAGATILVTIVAAIVVVGTVDGEALGNAVDALASRPLVTLGGVAAFAIAFIIRAFIWARMLPGVGFAHAWSGIHLALAGNHLLPFRLGEPLRVVSVARRTTVATADAGASTVTLRSADLLTIIAIAVLLGGGRLPALPWPVLAIAAIGLITVGLGGLTWIGRLRRRHSTVKWPDPLVLTATATAWLAEAGLIWVVAHATGIDITYLGAVFVTAISVASQVAAITPGGFGTYEAAAVAAYAYLGHDPGVALAAALAAHALKTTYSLLTGAIALIAPAPTLLGQLRLPSRLPERPSPRTVTDDQPVVVVFPAHDEEDSVTGVIERVPDETNGHPISILVIDDGSTDATAELARDAGAEVVSLVPNQGLGAAIRHGFLRALELDPAAVVFLDADGEYAPEEIGDLVDPILRGDADYVVGSRFAGHITRMLPHRRFGNKVLTVLLSAIARRRIDDGQSGYRALSRSAVEKAEIIHDYNYAQVLTLDLLRKGFVYAEVPISYHFRTSGRSFIRLGRYLRNVVPAIYRVLNADQASERRPTPAR